MKEFFQKHHTERYCVVFHPEFVTTPSYHEILVHVEEEFWRENIKKMIQKHKQLQHEVCLFRMKRNWSFEIV